MEQNKNTISNTKIVAKPSGFSSKMRAADTFSFTLNHPSPVIAVDGGRVPSVISIYDGTANINLYDAKMSVLNGTDTVTCIVTNLPALDSDKSYRLLINDANITVTDRAFQPKDSANTDIKALNNGIHISSIDTRSSSVYMVPLYKVEHLLAEIDSTDSSMQTYEVVNSAGAQKALSNDITQGDKLIVTAENGTIREYALHISTLKANLSHYTIGQTQDIVLEYSINLANPNRQFLYGTLIFTLPDGITASPTDCFDLIGRGFVDLNNDAVTAAPNYNHSGRNWVTHVGNNDDLRTKVKITNGGQTVVIENTDYSNYNGVDLTLVLKNKIIPSTGGSFTATFTGSGYPSTTATAAEDYTETGTTKFNVSTAVSDLVRMAEEVSYSTPTIAVLEALSSQAGTFVHASLDKGLTWENTDVAIFAHRAVLTNLLSDTTYYFKLMTDGGSSNVVSYYTGLYDVTQFGAVADATITGTLDNQNIYSGTDNTASINAAIVTASRNGGGIVYFKGNSSFGTGTLHLRSNVHLYLDENSQLVVLPNIDPTESNLNLPFVLGQDVGHCYWQDSLMWGVRVENIKIIGNSAKIYGNMNLHIGDDPTPAGAGTKTISLKLAKDIVIGGIDESHLLIIEQGGWFAILTTGCDNIRVQNILLPHSTAFRQRDTFNFMANNNASAYNVTTLKSSNDIAKLGSDFSLGFVRHVSNIHIEKIVAGDIRGGNVFQLGSETVGDMENITVTDLTLTTNSNKTGVAIWVNDGSNIRNVFFSKLNLANTSGGIAFGVLPRYEAQVNGISVRLPNEIRRPGSLSNVTVDGAVLSRNAGGHGGFPILIQGYKRCAGTGADTWDFGSVGTMIEGTVYPVKNVTLKNVQLTASYNAAKFVPQLSDAFSVIAEAKNNGNYRTSAYTNATIFPAYGILMKYVDQVTVSDSKITYDDTLRYDRYAIVIDNGTNVKLNNLDILLGGLVGGAVQVRGVSSYEFSGIQCRTFIKDYLTKPPLTMESVTGSTHFDSAVQENLLESYVYPVFLPASLLGSVALPDAALDLAYTNKVLDVAEKGGLAVIPGALVQAVLDGIISLKPVKALSVVDASGTAISPDAVVVTGYRLKVAAPDGSITYMELSCHLDS